MTDSNWKPEIDDLKRRIADLEANKVSYAGLDLAIDAHAYDEVHHIHDAAPPPVEPPPPIDEWTYTGPHTSDVNNALLTLPEGKTLVLPAGTYQLTDPLAPQSNRNVRCEPGVRFVQQGRDYIWRVPGLSNAKLWLNGAVHWKAVYDDRGGGNIFSPRKFGEAAYEFMHNVEIYDMVVEQTDGWAVIFYGEGLLIDGYVNNNRDNSNRNIDDGLDIWGKRITVRNFDIGSNDDGISIKCWSNTVPTSDVLIENGRIRSRDGGLTFGSEIKGGGIDGVTVRNVDFDDVGVPIYFKQYNTYSPAGEVKNVLIDGVSSVSRGNTDRVIFAYVRAQEHRKDKVEAVIRNLTHTGGWNMNSVLIQDQPRITIESSVGL